MPCISSTASADQLAKWSEGFQTDRAGLKAQAQAARKMIESLKTDPSSVNLDDLLQACKSIENGVGDAAMAQIITKGQ